MSDRDEEIIIISNEYKHQLNETTEDNDGDSVLFSHHGKRFAFIGNPKAANGKTKTVLKFIKKELQKTFGKEEENTKWKLFETQYSGHAKELILQAVELGFNVFVSIGGDGTHNEVVNGIEEAYRLLSIEDQQRFPYIMGIIPSGTGGDLQRTFGTKHFNVKQHLHSILYTDQFHTHVKNLDLVSVQCIDRQHSDQSIERFAINISSVGISSAICDAVNSSSKALGGFVTFLFQLCFQTLIWKNKKIRYQIDDGEWKSVNCMNFSVANGKYFGGGIKIAPLADPTDGLLDITSMNNFGVFDVMTLFKLYDGSFVGSKKVDSEKGRVVIVESEKSNQNVLVDVDGEVFGLLPARFTIIPNRIPFICVGKTRDF